MLSVIERLVLANLAVVQKETLIFIFVRSLICVNKRPWPCKQGKIVAETDVFRIRKWARSKKCVLLLANRVSQETFLKKIQEQVLLLGNKICFCNKCCTLANGEPLENQSVA